MKVGIFGGTFNPPHVGHLIVAEHVRTELSLDRILFVPAFIPPHKLNDDVVSSDHRVAMLKLAIKDNPGFEISETELRRGGVSFTVDTLQGLTSQHPADEFVLLIGMDNLLEFHTWKSPARILELAKVVVMTRPGFSEKDNPLIGKVGVNLCSVPEIGISSTEIRKRVHEGRSIRYLVPDSVRDYLFQQNLYRTER